MARPTWAGTRSRSASDTADHRARTRSGPSAAPAGRAGRPGQPPSETPTIDGEDRDTGRAPRRRPARRSLHVRSAHATRSPTGATGRTSMPRPRRPVRPRAPPGAPGRPASATARPPRRAHCRCGSRHPVEAAAEQVLAEDPADGDDEPGRRGQERREGTGRQQGGEHGRAGPTEHSVGQRRGPPSRCGPMSPGPRRRPVPVPRTPSAAGRRDSAARAPPPSYDERSGRRGWCRSGRPREADPWCRGTSRGSASRSGTSHVAPGAAPPSPRVQATARCAVAVPDQPQHQRRDEQGDSLIQYWNACTSVMLRMPPAATLTSDHERDDDGTDPVGAPVTARRVSPAPWNCGTR